MAASVDFWAEETITENTVISVMPMVSAAVVVATRCGLRRALAVASCAVTLVSRAGSQPRQAMTGGAISGPRASRATKHRQPPAASPVSPVPEPQFTPEYVSPAPAATEPVATATRRQPIRAVIAGSTATVSAASGATRVAALAGSTDAATVTSRPVASAMVIADGLITSGGWVLTTRSSPQLTA